MRSRANPSQPAPFGCVSPGPDALEGQVDECVVQAVSTHRAAHTDGLGRVGSLDVGGSEPQLRALASACGPALPRWPHAGVGGAGEVVEI